MQHFFLLFIFFYTSSTFANKICQNYYFVNTDIELTSNEKILICGSKSDGWSEIPKNQALGFLNSFLASRGYYKTKVKRIKNRTEIEPGDISVIKKIEFLNAPTTFNKVKYNKSINSPLTDKNLNDIESWTETRLEAIGFPCAKVEIVASYESGEVRVTIDPKDHILIKRIIREDVSELNSQAFERFDSIGIGDSFNNDYLLLTSRKMIGSGLTSYSYFSHSCNTEPGIIKQKIILNKPNLITLGVGVSTEEFPILKASWKNSRIDRNGTNIQSLLYLSSIERSIELNSTIYLIKDIPRFSLKPFITYKNINEKVFQTESRSIGTEFKKTYDIYNYSSFLSLTTSYTNEIQISGEAPGESRFYAIDFDLNAKHHYFEFFRNSPRIEDEYSFNISHYRSSQTNGSLLEIYGTKLFNIKKNDPPSHIFGARLKFKSLSTDDFENTPQEYRLHLGGENDLRGFARKSINNKEKGFKTTIHFALESRFNTLLPYSLQPLLFIDFASAGLEQSFLEKEIYYSPGFGMRWESPFGSFRSTLARGLTANNTNSTKDQTTFIFSFGKEF